MLSLRLPFVGSTLLFVLAAAQSASGQYTYTADDVAAIPGDSISVPIILENTDPVRGFSLGLTYDDSVLTLDAIAQGSDLLAMNADAGADYFYTNLDPDGGPGGTVGCVITLGADIDEIPADSTSEIAVFDFTVATTATTGTSASLDFSDELGTPAVALVVSVDGVSEFPSTVSGAVAVMEAFRRGDDNGDGRFDISDAIHKLDLLFDDGTQTCEDAADTSDDGSINLADVIYFLEFLFEDGENPAAPYPDCAVDPTADSLSCESYDCS